MKSAFFELAPHSFATQSLSTTLIRSIIQLCCLCSRSQNKKQVRYNSTKPASEQNLFFCITMFFRSKWVSLLNVMILRILMSRRNMQLYIIMHGQIHWVGTSKALTISTPRIQCCHFNAIFCGHFIAVRETPWMEGRGKGLIGRGRGNILYRVCKKKTKPKN